MNGGDKRQFVWTENGEKAMMKKTLKNCGKMTLWGNA